MLYIEMEEVQEQSDQPPPSVTIDGVNEDCHAWLLQCTHKALQCVQKKDSELSVLLVTDEEMSVLHLKHSGIEGTTDVLTFDLGSNEQSVLADIAICVDVAAREATVRNHSIQEELLLYIVHGMLHCCGFDDHDEMHHQRMHAEEDRILTEIGVGSVWSNSQ
jgi:rRNA maturation RNase YbeY